MKRVPDSIRERIAKLAKEGSTTREICDRTGVSLKAIRKFCKEAGVSPKSRYEKRKIVLTSGEVKDTEEDDVAAC